MTKERLIELGVSEELCDKILSEFEADNADLMKERDTALQKADGLSKQLSEANEAITAFGDVKPEELKEKITEWEEKYKKDTDELKKQLEEQEINHQTEKFMGNYSFTSELAKNAALTAFREKGFKFEDGKFLGADEFMKELQKENPSAFGDNSKGVPKIITGSEGSAGGVDEATARAVMGI